MILFNVMETLGLKKDAAVYYAVISAVQSAAQSRRLLESKARIWPEREGVTGGVPTGGVTTGGVTRSTEGVHRANEDTTKIPISAESKNAASSSAVTKLPDEDASAAALLTQVDAASHSPYQHTLSHPINKPLTHPINTSLTYPINTLYHTPYQHTLSHPINKHLTHPINTLFTILPINLSLTLSTHSLPPYQ